ncbi:hypothetical protein HNR73_003543 [Phytomonospora endophytica]|uniref:DOD-type homing endonuclease domain-containing protein n=1 Tax=Phytomonospora endophytica TaxID=714109 RepID=A0A841FT26_9ACTN|nr:hypothetical protein [Phytomonospora endophytica]
MSYAYLLGLYLGDGDISAVRDTPRLRISCTAAYTDLLVECAQAMRAVLPNRTGRVTRGGCTVVQSHSRHWPCLFPQHGRGRKHERPIVLAHWQRDILTAHPKPFLRGLIHSDGWRGVNHTTVKGKRYEYVRYQFANESADILALCGWALDLVGAEWRYSRYNVVSVAKKHSVALLETFIGPKTLGPQSRPSNPSPDSAPFSAFPLRTSAFAVRIAPRVSRLRGMTARPCTPPGRPSTVSRRRRK